MSEISKTDQLPFAIVLEGAKEDVVTDEEILRRREEEYKHFLVSEVRLVQNVSRAVIAAVVYRLKQGRTFDKYTLFEIPEVKDIPVFHLMCIRDYLMSSTMQQLLDKSLTSTEKKKFKINVREIRLRDALEHGVCEKRLWLMIRKREEEKEARSKLNYIVDVVCGLLAILFLSLIWV